MSKDSETKIRKGSENVFADLGYSDSGTHLLKAQQLTVSCECLLGLAVRLTLSLSRRAAGYQAQ